MRDVKSRDVKGGDGVVIGFGKLELGDVGCATGWSEPKNLGHTKPQEGAL